MSVNRVDMERQTETVNSRGRDREKEIRRGKRETNKTHSHRKIEETGEKRKRGTVIRSKGPHGARPSQTIKQQQNQR